MRRYRLISVAAGALLLAGSLAACGDDTENEPTTDPTTAESSEGPAQQEVAEDEPTEDESAEDEPAAEQDETPAASGDRPTGQELGAVFLSQDTTGAATEEFANCLGQFYVDSDLPDELLRALADLDDSYVPSAEDQTAFIEMSAEAGRDCGITLDQP